MGGKTVDVTGNPLINPAIVTNYEVSWDHTFTGAQVGVRLFAQQNQDLKVMYSTLAPPDIAATATTEAGYIWTNRANSNMSGVEASAKGKIEAFTWGLNYTYTYVKDIPFAGMNLDLDKSSFAKITPESRGNLNLGWENGPLTIDTFLHYTGDFYGYTQAGTPIQIKSYVSLGANINYNLESGTTISISGQNLGQSEQIQTAGFPVPRQVFLQLSQSY